MTLPPSALAMLALAGQRARERAERLAAYRARLDRERELAVAIVGPTLAGLEADEC